jgi:tetratricopeptide (TPR) repeat protein
MQTMNKHLTAIFLALTLCYCKSGLVTTSNSCYNAIANAEAQNRAANYSDALQNFNNVLSKCDAYDAKEKAYAGKAASLNGLKQYNDALTAANAGLKINQNSINNLFEKASAELGLGMTSEAHADLNTVLSLTQKNQHASERATIYAKIAAMDSRQQLYPDAMSNIGQAITLDNSNPEFYVLRGDIQTAAGNFSEALESYDVAIAKGKTDFTAYKAKVTTMLKMDQKKYGTDNADILAKKMNSSEKQNLCTGIRNAQDKGMKDITIDLVQSAICK